MTRSSSVELPLAVAAVIVNSTTLAMATNALDSDSSNSSAASTMVSALAPPPPKANNGSSNSDTRAIITDSSTSSNGGQRYDLVIVVASVATVIIVALLLILRRNTKRARMTRDVYKSSCSDDDDDDRPAAHQTLHPNQMQSRCESTWKVATTSLRVSSPTLTQSTGDNDIDNIDSHTSSNDPSSNNEPVNGIWRDPVIAAARIPFDAIRMRSLLCRGAFGEVFDGVYLTNRVAIKRLLPETRFNVEHLEYFMLEVRLMATLRHPRVVLFVGVAWDALADLCIVSELMAQGDLRLVLQRWHADSDGASSLGFHHCSKLRIALHVAEALAYLHSLSPRLIIHRDLKSRNILLDSVLNAKLSDFGVSREHSGQLTRTLTANIGSSLWMAPEIMLGENYDETADLFSFGIVLTELDTLALPYHDVATPDGRRLPEPAVLHMVTIGAVQAQFSAESRQDVVALGKRCLSLDRSERPRAAELVERFRAMLLELGEPFDAA